MQIQQRLENDFKQALKSKNKVALSTLRMLKAALQNKEIEKKGQALKEAEVIKIIARQVQQHQDSIEQFNKGKRQDLVEKESKELEILKNYLPEQLSEEELQKVVRKIIAETGVKDEADFGKVMKLAMAEFKGRADGKLVSRIVNTHLNKEKP